MDKTVSKSEAKQKLIKELDTFLARQKYKKVYFLSSKTSYSTKWFGSYGAVLDLKTAIFKLTINIMKNGEVSITMRGDSFSELRSFEESYVLLKSDDYDSLTEFELDDIIQDAKNRIRHYVKLGKKYV
jgi:hypothetical protein